MKTKVGILYGMKHQSWFEYKKMGRTTQTIKKRISNMKTSLLGNIDIIYTTNELIDCYFYEYLMKQILKKYRIKPNKEMFNVDESDIEIIFNFFNELNDVLNDEIKLNNYINLNYPEYFKKRKYYNLESSSNSLSNDKPKKKKRKILYVDTSY
jgi:hypothetical protein